MLYHRKEQNLICCCASTWSTSLHGQPLWVSSTWQGRCSGEQEDLMIERNLTAWFSRPNGKLVTYGPYAQDGVLTPESNQQVDIKNWSPLRSISVWSESSFARRIVGNPRHQGTKRGCSGSRPQPGPGWQNIIFLHQSLLQSFFKPQVDLNDGQFQSNAMSMVHFSTAMRYRLFLEKLNIAIVAIIFLDHRERLFCSF